MPDTQVTLNSLLDQAIEKLPFVRKNVFKFRCKNRKFRAQVLADLQLKLSEDERASALFPFSLADEAVTAETTIAIDPNNLKAILDLIIEYLPKIIELISLLFPATILLLAIFSGMSTASAQDCPNGYCPNRARPHAPVVNTVKSTVAKTAKVASVPVRIAAPVIAPQVVATAPIIAPTCDCPNCNCAAKALPLSTPVSVVAQTSQVPYPVNPELKRPGHWSYPGRIDDHLLLDHGVSTSYMTREEKLDLHDALHEQGRAVPNNAQYTHGQVVTLSGPIRRLLGR